jgi:hypothetical protein
MNPLPAGEQAQEGHQVVGLGKEVLRLLRGGFPLARLNQEAEMVQEVFKLLRAGLSQADFVHLARLNKLPGLLQGPP